MSTTGPGRELTVREAARRVHRAEETIRRWIWTGKLPARKLGTGYQVHERDLDAIAGVPTPREPGESDLSLGEWVAAVKAWRAGNDVFLMAALASSSSRIERSGRALAIVDASVVIEVVAPDADDTEATHVLFDHWAQTGEGLHAPAMLPLEVMNALLTGVRRGRWDGQAADAASGFVASLPISLHADPADRHRAWDLARRYDNHPIYDMLYVALAERLGQPLITVNDKLRHRLAHLSLILPPNEALKSAPPPSD